MIFLYHSGLQALVFPRSDAPGRMAGVRVKDLQAAGWKVTEEDLRRALPRADATALAMDTDVEAASRGAQVTRQLNGHLRAGRH